MNKAIVLMKEDLQQIIKYHMIQAGFEQSETEESHKMCLSFVSKFIVLESEKKIRYKSHFAPSEVKRIVKKQKSEITSPLCMRSLTIKIMGLR